MVLAVGAEGGQNRGVHLAGRRREQRLVAKVLQRLVRVVVQECLHVLGLADAIVELFGILRLDLVEIEHQREGEVLERLPICLGQALGGALELDDLHDAEAMALGENVEPKNLKWVMTPRELIKLRKIKATDGNYIVQPDVTAAGGYTLLGHPVIVTKRVPDLAGTPNTGRAALLDFSQVAVARDLAPTVKILDQTFGDYDQMAIRVVCRYDAKPLNAEAVIKLTGITI